MVPSVGGEHTHVTVDTWRPQRPLRHMGVSRARPAPRGTPSSLHFGLFHIHSITNDSIIKGANTAGQSRHRTATTTGHENSHWLPGTSLRTLCAVHFPFCDLVAFGLFLALCFYMCFQYRSLETVKISCSISRSSVSNFWFGVPALARS